MIEKINPWLENIGLSLELARMVSNALAVILVLLFSLICYWVANKIVVRLFRLAVQKTENQFDDALLRNKVFSALASGVIPMVWYLLSENFSIAELWIKRLSLCALTVVAIIVLSRILNSALEIYNSLEISKKKPLKSFAQVVKIFLFCLGGIFFLAILLDKSPWGFLSGIGALSAILLIVFRDPLLGLVGGFQLTVNNMLRIGDWIEMPKYGADGDVMDLTLTSVKVQNFDKTIVTIPTYALVSDSFKNWRGMSESGGRRIKRHINIDMTSVRFLDDSMMKKFEKYELLKSYLREKKAQLEKLNLEDKVDLTEYVNGRRMTNLGTFRAYVAAYLKSLPYIAQDLTFLIRQLQPTDSGIPLEIYVFSKDQVWANYEAFQADIFDHILAVVPEFGLRVFQKPTGADVAKLGLSRV